MSVIWVITEKLKDGRIIIKARLVVRGFEEDSSNLKKDSPTCSREAIRILITIASSMHWECNTVDVKSAYLQGDNIQREIYVRPPPEFRNGFLWRLKKTVYGLCDAARAWYMRVKYELKNLGVKMSSLDNSLFFWHNKGRLEGIICIYVDDFLWAGTTNFNNHVIKRLKEKFLIGSSASATFTYLGLSIKSYEDGITIDQSDYISSLKPIPINKERKALYKADQLSDSEKGGYRSLNGQFGWISTHTRPDIAFDTCAQSVAYTCATVAHLIKLNKLVDRVKATTVNLFFPRLQSLEKCIIEVYTDAAYRNLANDGSQGGYLIFLKDETGKSCPISWQSKRLDKVIDSVLGAEALALVEGAKQGIYLAAMLKQIIGHADIKVICLTDNKSLADSLASVKQVHDKRLRLDTSVLENMLENNEINQIVWVKSSEQLADALTKKGVCTDKLQAMISRN